MRFSTPRSIVIVGVVLATFTSLMPVASAGTQRAMWVWSAPTAETLSFASSQAVTDVYLHTPPGFSSDPAFAQYLSEAQARGIAVHAMAGDPAWAKRPDALVSWIEEVVAAGGYAGIVADIEPYLLPEWSHPKRRARLLGKYLDGLSEANAAAGATPLVAAVPFWWDLPEYSVSDVELVEDVLQRTDGIVVMAYRDSALGTDGIVDHASVEVGMASKHGKSAVVGVETGAATLDKVTFAEEGSAAMEAELTLVAQEFATQSGFGGVAIHHYGSWVALVP